MIYNLVKCVGINTWLYWWRLLDCHLILADFKEKKGNEDEILSFPRYFSMVAKKLYVVIPTCNLFNGSKDCAKIIGITLTWPILNAKKNEDHCYIWKCSTVFNITEEYNTIYCLFMHIVYVILQFIVAKFKTQISKR